MKDRPGGMIERNWGNMHSDREVIKSLFEAVIFYSQPEGYKGGNQEKTWGWETEKGRRYPEGGSMEDRGNNVLDPV